jgi:hypothetical protein
MLLLKLPPQESGTVRRRHMAERFTHNAISVTGAGKGMGRASALAFARASGVDDRKVL